MGVVHSIGPRSGQARHDAPDPLDELLGRCARGDHAAFAGVYDSLAPLVHGIVLRVVRDPAQSEEVTQEVFVDLWRHAGRFDSGRGTIRAWATTVAHRRAVDRVRTAQASTNREQRVAHLDTQPTHDAVSEEVEHRLEREQVRRALTDLTELQREALTLAYYGGYTQREVSDILDVPLGTIKTRMRDGLIRLRDALGVAS